MLVKVNSSAVNGLSAMPVFIEINTLPGKEFFMVGLPDNAVRESRTRVESALFSSGYHLREAKITVNFAPADVRKEGSGYDLPLAVGLLAASHLVPTEALENNVFTGELGLDGSIRPVKGALAMAIKARSEGYECLFVPKENVREAVVVNRLKVYGVSCLSEVVDHLNGRHVLEPTTCDTRKEFFAAQGHHTIDFADVKGQENVKRAIEVAAAGGHNLMLVGSPGCGKSMMAKRIPTILPPLTLAESLETTLIHSVAGKLNQNVSLITERPFRAPHHTISNVALVGGGTNPQPGEISLAHNGVLFCDELGEFRKEVLEVLRQPIEDRKIVISRAKYTVEYPASFMLVASTNPCPCGYYGDPTHHCVCSPGQISKYMSKFSGPLMDRIDIQCEIQPLTFDQISKKNTPLCEGSSSIRERVINVRNIQEIRYKDYKGIHCNAQMTERMIHEFAEPDEQGLALLRMAMAKLSLSARAYTRILKVARTIADLAGSEKVEDMHIAEAIGYRNLDRGDWAERGL